MFANALFATPPLEIAPDAWLLPGFAQSDALLAHIHAVAAEAAFRYFKVPGGHQMSVAMTNCGNWGWTSDEIGYAYTLQDPLTHTAWPSMPLAFKQLAREAASAAGWNHFEPDACLINRYSAGAGMGLHQDRHEKDLSAPIVSVSLGASAKFIVGGLLRSDPVKSMALKDGDVLVWGGRSRLVFHGVRPLAANSTERYNLTFRKAQ
jgi:alkylated DNA repair protein (DNA oxidative demethylase)